MREIKFRAWDGKQMAYPQELYGDIRNEFAIALSGEVFDFREVSNGNYCPSTLESKRRGDITLMQSTGLKDKNGKEIFEGDILCCPHFPANGTWHYLYHEVIWDEKLQLWKAVSIGNKEGKEITAHGNPMLWVYIKNEPNGEIIGNIYENPELLNSEQELKRSVATDDAQRTER